MSAGSRRLLLLSSSRIFGSGYLDYAESEISAFLAGVGRVLFVPHALHDRNAYAARARERLGRMGFEVDSLHEQREPVEAIAGAGAVFIGGGNTFRLLDALDRFGWILPIRRRVAAGMPYLGASAGSNVACPTIRTTNDMPIVAPRGLDALGLIPFQINAHYFDPDPSSKHQGETREERLAEFHEENETPVLALREGAMLRVEGSTAKLSGLAGARLFRAGAQPESFEPGAALDFLLLGGPRRG